MKNRYIFAVLLCGLAIISGCQKDEMENIPEGALMISSESYASSDGSKTSVSDASVQWENSDEVKLNGETKTVTVSDGKAYVTDFTIPSTPFYGNYPANLTVGTPNIDITNVTVPASYNSTYSGSRQVLHLPMVAKAEGNAKAIRFRHITAAVKVVVKNTTGVDVVLDSVVVSSRGVQLSGTRSVTIGVGSASVAAQASGDVAAADTSVRVVFTNSPVIQMGGSDIKEVQVPILPIAAGNLTIKVYTHVPGMVEADNQFVFSHRASNNALERNVMMTARINLKSSGTGMVIVPKGLFSVSSTKKVYFSQGNLFASVSNGIITDYKFADNQYSTAESSSVSNNYVGYTGNVGLFGWGNNSNNLNTSTTPGDYASTDLTGSTDWGSLSISGTHTGWRTLTSLEWSYLLNPNGNSGRSDNIRYAMANIHSTNGLILFPDGFNPTTMGVTISNENPQATTSSQVEYTPYSDDNWAKMEAAGAIFLPAAGIRNGTSVSVVAAQGNYWSATCSSNNQAHRLLFSGSDFAPYNAHSRYLGCSVRLVKEAN